MKNNLFKTETISPTTQNETSNVIIFLPTSGVKPYEIVKF